VSLYPNEKIRIIIKDITEHMGLPTLPNVVPPVSVPTAVDPDQEAKIIDEVPEVVEDPITSPMEDKSPDEDIEVIEEVPRNITEFPPFHHISFLVNRPILPTIESPRTKLKIPEIPPEDLPEDSPEDIYSIGKLVMELMPRIEADRKAREIDISLANLRMNKGWGRDRILST